jgi:hypothetical protein
MKSRLASTPPDARSIPYKRWIASLPITAFYDAAELDDYRRQQAVKEQKQNERRDTPPSQRKKRRFS